MLSIKRNRSAEILILGDLILDRYIEGHVRRISPEAPVPVLFQTSDRYVLGGAGNVAHNIHTLGGKAVLVGLLGDDEAGLAFRNKIKDSVIELVPVIYPDRKTTVKTRLLGDRQQLLRVDNEDTSDINNTLEIKILDVVAQQIKKVSAVIISDYRKGLLTPFVLTETIKLAREHNLPVLVDPKGQDYHSYIGSDYIKPNRSELELLTKIPCKNFEDVRRAAKYLIQETGSNILVTLSQEGMILFKKDGSEFCLPTEAKEVFDVSGAGDTAIASFAYALVTGENPENSARIANIASGIAVSKIGTAAVSFDEINREIMSISAHKDQLTQNLVEIDRAISICKDWKNRGFKIGFTNGCFDLVHPGHIALLRGAAAECDRLIVGLNSDNSVRRLKGDQRPIQSELARADVVGALKCVDLIVIFAEDTPLEIIKALEPDVIIKGSDYEEKNIVGAEFVKSYGGYVTRVELREGYSTTSLVKRSNSN